MSNTHEKHNSKKQNLLSIAQFLDEARWSKAENYEMILHKDRLDDKQITLLHYLLYIMDRQMPYEIIWGRGSFVFSKIMRDYCKGQSIDELLWVGKEYVRYTTDNTEDDTKNKTKNKTSIEFYCKNDNGETETFKSRFMTTDYKSIYSTLYVLDKLADRDLITFCEKVVDAYSNENDIIRRLAYALHLMTYEHPAKETNALLEEYLSTIQADCENIVAELESYLRGESIGETHDGFCSYKDFCTKQTYSSKRLWCAIRDYIQSPEYNKAFVPAMNSVLEMHGKGKIDDYIYQLELPGDVWNNNPDFVQCVCEICDESKPKTTHFNKFIRETLYSDEDSIACFDVSFSLVPRVCNGNADCKSCPFGIIRDKSRKAHNIEKMCVNDTNKWCPLVLYSTGYKMDCVGKENCELMRLHNEYKQ